MDYYIVEEEAPHYGRDTRNILETLVGKDGATKLYEYFNSEFSILEAREEDYRAAGLSDKKAKILDAARNMHKVKQTQHESLEKIRCSLDCVKHLLDISDEPVEHFVVLVLNRANAILAKVKISQGGLSGTVVDTKVLFGHVLRYRTANAIVLSHNHPSGNLQASESDIELTKKIVAGAKLLDIKVLDHIIVHGHRYLSFADESLL
jgi:DNA repair protein RadC